MLTSYRDRLGRESSRLSFIIGKKEYFQIWKERKKERKKEGKKEGKKERKKERKKEGKKERMKERNKEGGSMS